MASHLARPHSWFLADQGLEPGAPDAQGRPPISQKTLCPAPASGPRPFHAQWRFSRAPWLQVLPRSIWLSHETAPDSSA